MGKRWVRVLFAAPVAFAVASADAQAAPRLGIPWLGYRITGIEPVQGQERTFDVTARAGVVNLRDPATNVTASVTGTPPGFIVLEGTVTFGNVPRTPPLKPQTSQDTFQLRITLPARTGAGSVLRFLLAGFRSLTWDISCADCGVNRPPIANAGSDQTVTVGQTVLLDGSASSDPDGQPLAFDWSFVSRPPGSSAVIGDPTSVSPSFVPDRPGDYVVRLVVSDGVAGSAPDTMNVSTSNSAPVANAGPDQEAVVGQEVVLDGSASSDIDGDPLTYAWSLVDAPPGSQAVIVEPAQVLAQFTPDLEGQYVIELIVDDGTRSSAPDAMVISTSAANRLPVANAGQDQSARVGDTVQLDGTASTDPDFDPLTYAWSLTSRPPSSAAALEDAQSATPTLSIDRPGTYVAQLIVRDGRADSTPDTVVVSTLNSPPVAQIEAEASVTWRETVELDGSASTDADGDTLAYAWAVLSRPTLSQASISDPGSPRPSFVADRPGLYVVQLVVNDGQVTSVPVSVSIAASNQAPVAVDDSGATSPGSDVVIDVLANDSDADGDPLSIESVSAPSHGTAIIDGGSVRYVPAQGFSGVDSFLYGVSDGADTSTALVTVTVQDTGPVDSDGDGLTDAEELALGTDPHDPDSDDDNLSDGDEVTRFLTDPRLADTDGDGFRDDAELFAGSNPSSPSSSPLPSTGPTSEELIDAAMAGGQLTLEQALIYRMFAAFADPRLPAEYRGAPSPNLDSRIVSEVAVQLPNLSPATQEILRPFYILPIYEGSWFTERFQAQSAAPASALTEITTADDDLCVHATSALFDVMVTAHANIHYASNRFSSNSPTAHPRGLQTAQIVAKYIEEVWAKETDYFGRFPLSDANLPSGCNGGDGALDIVIVPSDWWIADYGSQTKARAITVAYEEGCHPRPAHIVLRALSAYLDPNIDRPEVVEKEIRAALAHEFFHAIEFGYPLSAACSDYDWLGEATANWAIDLVYPDDQKEHPYAAGYMYAEHLVPLDQAYRGDRDETNGYTDYVFLQYLDRQVRSGLVKSIWEATAGNDSIGAIRASVPDLEEVWHDFARAAWNDFPDGLHHELHDADELEWGLKKTIEAPRPQDGTQEALRVELEGASHTSFELMSTVPGTGIERLSFHYDYMKFTDENVRFVSYQTHEINGPSDLDVRAFLKIGGQWREEDWSDLGDEGWYNDFAKSFCRDEREESIEELVLVYSNGNPDRPSDPIVMNRKPKLWVSNGSCYRFSGTSRVTETNSRGGVQVGTATVTFQVDKSLRNPDFHQSRRFRPVSGTATIQRSGPDFSGLCQLTYPFNSAPIQPSEGSLTIQYAGPGTPNTLYGSGISGIPNTTIIVQCGSSEPETQQGTVPSAWLLFPLTGTSLSEDGRSIAGSTTQPSTGKTYEGVWNFVAESQN